MNRITKEELEKEFIEIYELSSPEDIQYFKITGTTAILFAEYIVNRGVYWDDQDSVGC